MSIFWLTSKFHSSFLGLLTKDDRGQCVQSCTETFTSDLLVRNHQRSCSNMTVVSRDRTEQGPDSYFQQRFKAVILPHLLFIRPLPSASSPEEANSAFLSHAKLPQRWLKDSSTEFPSQLSYTVRYFNTQPTIAPCGKLKMKHQHLAYDWQKFFFMVKWANEVLKIKYLLKSIWLSSNISFFHNSRMFQVVYHIWSKKQLSTFYISSPFSLSQSCIDYFSPVYTISQLTVEAQPQCE